MAAFELDPAKAEIRFFHSLLLSMKLGDLVSAMALPSLNGRQLGSILLQVPGLPEQRAIAAALGDVDALLAGLDRLIAKKRDLNQAAMQTLLTGQTRLPGFSGEWEVKRLGDLGDIDADNLSSGTDPTYRLKYISLENIDKGRLLGFADAEFVSAPSRVRRRLQKDDVLILTVRPNLQAHLHFEEQSVDWVCSTGFAVFRSDRAKSNAGYVYQQLLALSRAADRRGPRRRISITDLAGGNPRDRARALGIGASADSAHRHGGYRRSAPDGPPDRRRQHRLMARRSTAPRPLRPARGGSEGGTTPDPAGFLRPHPRPVPHKARPDRRLGCGGRYRRPAGGTDQSGLIEPENPRQLPRPLHHRP